MSNRNRKRRPRPAVGPPGVDIDLADVFQILQQEARDDQMLRLQLRNAGLQAALNETRRQAASTPEPELEPVEDEAEEELVEEEDTS